MKLVTIEANMEYTSVTFEEATREDLDALLPTLGSYWEVLTESYVGLSVYEIEATYYQETVVIFNAQTGILTIFSN